MDRLQRGLDAEQLVVNFLESSGLRVVARNLRLGHLEVDIVAREDRTIAIVEVRTRGAGAWTSGFGSIDWRKRRRIRVAGARLWRKRYRHDETVSRLRFDAASVALDEGGAVRIEYVKAAF